MTWQSDTVRAAYEAYGMALAAAYDEGCEDDEALQRAEDAFDAAHAAAGEHIVLGDKE